MLIKYNVVFGSLWPCMTICLIVFPYIVTPFLSKTAIQLLSHSVPIDVRGFCRPGNMCALRALSGRLCWGGSAMWDNVMISPFYILIGIGWVAVCFISLRGSAMLIMYKVVFGSL